MKLSERRLQDKRPETQSMGKPRVGVILRESVSVRGNKIRLFDRASEQEFKALKESFSSLLKKLDSLIRALHKQKEAMILLDQSKSNVAENLLELAKKSPVSAPAGNYSYIRGAALEKTKFKVEKLEQDAIDYVSKWKRVVQKRIVADTKATENKRVNMEHYQRKVNALKLTVERSLAKMEEDSNKPIPQELQEKFVRNVGKLERAKRSYHQSFRDLRSLMEECTDRGWRDLYPLLLKCAELDMLSTSDEKRLVDSLEGIVSELESLSGTHGASTQPRLDQFASASAESISTKPKYSYSNDAEKEPEADNTVTESDNETEEEEKLITSDALLSLLSSTEDKVEDEILVAPPEIAGNTASDGEIEVELSQLKRRRKAPGQ